MKLICLIAPLQEPVSLEEAKAYLRLSTDRDDGLVSTLIGAARSHVETITARSLLRQKWRMELTPPYPRSFPLVQRGTKEVEIMIPRPPLLEMDFLKAGGQNIPYRLFQEKIGASSLLWGQDIVLEFWGGYGSDPKTLPPDLKLGVLMAMRSFYEEKKLLLCPCSLPIKFYTSIK